MTFVVNITGHADKPEDEARAVDILQQAAADIRDVAQVSHAQVSTTHGGTVQLNSDSQENATAEADGPGHMRPQGKDGQGDGTGYIKDAEQA